MCKYCNSLKCDLDDNKRNIYEKTMECGPMGDFFAELYLTTDGDSKEINKLALSAWTNDKEIIAKEIDIAYCPFCGRDLRHDTIS